MKRFLAALIFAVPLPAHADDYVSDDPNSMFYRETWEAYDKLGDALGGMVFATHGAVFPECAKWITDWTMPPVPVVYSPPPSPIDFTPPPTPDTPFIEPVVPITPSVPVPETSTIAMLILGALGMLGLRWRRA